MCITTGIFLVVVVEFVVGVLLQRLFHTAKNNRGETLDACNCLKFFGRRRLNFRILRTGTTRQLQSKNISVDFLGKRAWVRAENRVLLYVLMTPEHVVC